MYKRKKDDFVSNVILNYMFKILTLCLGLVTVNVYLGYLGSSLYGLWITISSIVMWMGSGDFGIGNGLRNKLAEAYAENDIKKQKKVISTSVIVLSKISILLFVIMIIITEVLLRLKILQDQLRIPMYITTIFFSINLVIGLSQSIAYSYQKSWLSTMSNCLMQVLNIIIVLTIEKINIAPSLIVFAVINGICTILPNILLCIFLNKKEINFLDHILKYYDSNKLKDILNIGLLFFGLQICSIILYSTDNVIINSLFGSSSVTKYSVITKVYDSGTNLFSVLLIALWSAVTIHVTKNDFNWVKKKIKQLLLIWVFFSFGVVIVSFLFNDIINIWLSNNAIEYNATIVFVFALYCIITTGSSIFVNVLNGMGVVKVQLVLAVFESVINIPLSIFLGKNLGLGIIGVKLATLICVLISAIVLPVQVIYLLHKNKCGNLSHNR